MLNRLKFKIGAKLIIVAVLCIVPALIVVGFLLANQQRELLLSAVNASLDNTLNFAKDAIHQDLYHMQNEAKSIATDPKLRRALDTGSSLGINSRLNHIAKIRPELHYILLIDETKSVFAATTSNFSKDVMETEALLGNSITQHPHFVGLSTDQASISTPEKDPFLPQIGLSNSYTQWIIAPVRIRGAVHGWVILSYKFEETLSNLLQRLIERLQILGYPAISSSIVNTQEQVLATSLVNSSNGLTRKILLMLGDSNFQLIVQFDHDKVLAPLDKQQTTILVAFALLLGVLGLSLFLAVNHILLKPVRHLDEAALRLAKGELDYRVKLPGFDELAVLAQTFNKMAEQIAGSHEHLEAQVTYRTREVKEAAKHLAAQNKALEKSNADLEQFAYIASHDLKSPLNAIINIAGWIVEDCADILPKKSKAHLQLLTSRGNRMATLLDDLLSYSRVGRISYDAESIRLKPLVNNLFDLLGNPENFSIVVKNAELTVPRIPLELVIRNLVSNAIKHHDKERGNIEVFCESKAAEYHIRVQDDGPGIPPKLQHKALEMFQTLRPRDKVEGSGMGMALVKKTVEHYGGTLVIDSDGKNGTGIDITWPMQHSDKH